MADLTTASTDQHFSVDSEDDFRSGCEPSVTNNSSSQNYPHPDDHTIRTTDTPGFKPVTKSSSCFSADTLVQLKAIWTWLSFFCCSLGPTSTLGTKTTSLHFSVKCSVCFPLHVVHTRLLSFSALEMCQGEAYSTVFIAVYYCLRL